MVKLKLDEARIWRVLPKYSKEGMYMDGKLYNSFDNAKGIMKKKDVDLPTAVAGYPGTGKSTITIQIASFCDPTFTEDRMYQTVESFIEGVKNSNFGEAHALDESYEGMSSAAIRREVGRALLNVMNIIRQKRLYIFIVLPDFFDLSKNIAIFRTRWLIYCYSEEFGDIGNFAAFDRDTKQQLYIRGKKNEDYDVVSADFFGRFTKHIPMNFNWEKYMGMKDEALKQIFVRTHEDRNAINQRNKLIYYLHKKFAHNTNRLSKITGLGLRSIQIIIKQEKTKSITL